ncbi:MAG: helix-turn-helix domain-containing protein [Geminicoccaceae bacterium]|nr:helix-turn-helix domain-containing protein [Geminicoccaceae bacterium]MCS7267737.1 helix-turn-helix domain-containing protein [Geminicoccaceae bacterium]MCX7631032.1 helix-turn-helix domain-containing protein [Geminicoccaceae bacterium]MDW8125743.1 helix-turn-helix domain-containing protein [Geminicoccaceae bacterium]MDW8340334.1 helix-turn-helix domain-containing protein [Geminicoccaceae bacterium]
MKPAPESWARYISRYRRFEGLSQKAAARILGVSQATLSRWEAGKQVPALSTRRRLQERIEGRTGGARRTIVAAVERSPIVVILFDRRRRLLAASAAARDLATRTAPAESGQGEEAILFLLGPRAEEVSSGFREDELGRIDPVLVETRVELLCRDGTAMTLDQLWVPTLCAQGEYLYRVEMARLPAEGDRFPVSRKSASARLWVRPLARDALEAL